MKKRMESPSRGRVEQQPPLEAPRASLTPPLKAGRKVVMTEMG
ncbi:hypothetical protein MAR_008880 [Mya arenaria]|uniref:Uncharacterized protein n=1 Tax=Mya arenaria TaxID=6604 RepID=A0ABY7E0F5_MYAAR|nr:hypothetical protein MAR_008880 [Mya arenaria]